MRTRARRTIWVEGEELVDFQLVGFEVRVGFIEGTEGFEVEFSHHFADGVAVGAELFRGAFFLDFGDGSVQLAGDSETRPISACPPRGGHAEAIELAEQ